MFRFNPNHDQSFSASCRAVPKPIRARADSTRVVMRVTDEFGAICPFANDSIKLEIEGPAEITGDNPFSLIGGTGAVWIRAKEQAGTVRLTAVHPQLGSQQVTVEISNAPPETV